MKKFSHIAGLLFAFLLVSLYAAAAVAVDSIGTTLPGGTTIPWVEIGLIVTGIYELLARTIKTKIKFWSIIEIIYRVIQFLIPNRTVETVAKKEKNIFNFWRKN